MKGQISVSRQSLVRFARNLVSVYGLIKIYGSNWVKGHRGQRSDLCFFLYVTPRSLGRSSLNLEGRWSAAPDISLSGSFFESQGYRGQRSNLCFFFLFVPLLLPGPWADLHQTWCHFLNGQGHQGQRSNLCFSFCLFPYFFQGLGPIFTKLGGKVEGGPGY